MGHLIQRRVWGETFGLDGGTISWPATVSRPRSRRVGRSEQNPQAVRSWRGGRKYPAIRALARREKAVIFWGDEMGLRADHAAGRSFSPRGKTPVILGTGQRFRCNMISAITNRGHMQFMVFKERFTTAVFLKFLRRLLRQNRQKIFLIIDGHPVHIAKSTGTARFKEHQAAMRVYSLPGYSPAPNPERVSQPAGCQNQRGWQNQTARPKGIDRQRPGLPPLYSSPSLCRQTLFSGKTCPLCFSVKYLTLPVIIHKKVSNAGIKFAVFPLFSYRLL